MINEASEIIAQALIHIVMKTEIGKEKKIAWAQETKHKIKILIVA